MKFCKCKREFITKLFIGTISDAYEVADNMFIDAPDKVDLSLSKTDEVINIINSQCMCKENYITIVIDEDLPGEHVIKKCRTCKHQEVTNNEKQSQSPCEHPKDRVTELEVAVRKPNFVNNSDFKNELHWMYSHRSKERLWLCKACGLVTCKNPNDK